MTALVQAHPKQVHRLRDQSAERELLRALSLALIQLDQAQQRAIAFPCNELGGIELPPPEAAASDDQALIRAIATLYLTSQLELAGLVPAVELLSAVAASGGLQVSIGTAANIILQYWDERNKRFCRAERHAFFSRLFGTDRPDSPAASNTDCNTDFDELMVTLCETLYKLEQRAPNETRAESSAQAKLRGAARNLADNLLRQGLAIAAYAAQEIVTNTQQCVHILQHPELQRAFMEHSLWGVVREIFKRYRQTVADVENCVRRGKAGLVVLSWLAENSQSLPIDEPANVRVISAAQEWLEASLALCEGDSHVSNRG